MQYSSTVRQCLENGGEFWHGQTTRYYKTNGDFDKSSHKMVQITQQNMCSFEPMFEIHAGQPESTHSLEDTHRLRVQPPEPLQELEPLESTRAQTLEPLDSTRAQEVPAIASEMKSSSPERNVPKVLPTGMTLRSRKPKQVKRKSHKNTTKNKKH